MNNWNLELFQTDTHTFHICRTVNAGSLMLCILCCLIVRVSLILTAIHLGWLFCFLYSVQNAARTRCIFLASVGSSPLLFIVLSQANMVTAKCSFGIFKRRVIWNLIFSLGSCIFHIEIFEKHRELTVFS